ncbi:MAG: tetratricopeptide (TPR) repeat protein [Saprospiraceae bacterium]|jgi:tetratricopeptide (TPR) repeat protein
MNYLRLFYCISFLLITCIPATSVNAQIKQVSEEEVNTQKVFIDATKEKILGNYEKATTLFLKVLKRDEKNDVASYELARIYHVLEQNDEALKAIKFAITIDPNNDWYQLFLADLYEENGEFKTAVKIYDKLLDKNPKDAFFHEKLAFLLVKANQPKKAIDVYNDMEKHFGIHKDISQRKHRLYLGMGDKKKAAKELETLISYTPSNTDYYYMLASFHQQMGDKDLADEVYRRILKIAPSDVRASIALAEQSKTDGDDLSYLATLKPLFEKEDVNIDLKIKELIPYIQKVADGKSDPAQTEAIIALATTLENVHPREAKSYAAHADLLYYAGDKTGALVKYKEALKLNKSIFSLYEQVMYIYMEAGNFEALLSLSEDALDRFPNQAQAFYFNGLALGQLKKHKNAISSFRQALLMSRKNPILQVDIHNHLATEYYALSQFKKSDQSFEKALEINPNDHMVLNRYSSYLANRNENLEKAKSMSALSNELAPNQAIYQDTYGWILYRMKEYKAAKEWTSKALSHGGQKRPDILEHYGDILFQLKEIEEAVSYWQRALENGSQSSLLEKKIADRQIYE